MIQVALTCLSCGQQVNAFVRAQKLQAALPDLAESLTSVHPAECYVEVSHGEEQAGADTRPSGAPEGDGAEGAAHQPSRPH